VSEPRPVVYRVLSVALFFLAWAVLAWGVPPQFFPGPARVVGTILALLADASTYQYLALTAGRIAAGFVLSMLAGTAVGILMGARREAEAFFGVWVMVGLTVPAPAWAMVCVMLFGLSETGAALAITLLVAPFVAVNAWQGVRAMDAGLVEMARVFRLSSRALLREVVVPQLVPFLLAAARYGFGLVWKVVVIVEMIALGDGVGYALTSAFRSFEMYTVLAWTIVFAGLMLLIEVCGLRVFERSLTAWRPPAGLGKWSTAVVNAN
jgi:NitT/TauT family transport system permease protein